MGIGLGTILSALLIVIIYTAMNSAVVRVFSVIKYTFFIRLNLV